MMIIKLWPVALALGLSTAMAWAEPSADMKAVLDKLAELGAKPLDTLEVPAVRMQASPADAAKAAQWEKRIPSAPEGQIATKDIAIPTDAGPLPGRVYAPGGKGPFPVIDYFPRRWLGRGGYQRL